MGNNARTESCAAVQGALGIRFVLVGIDDTEGISRHLCDCHSARDGDFLRARVWHDTYGVNREIVMIRSGITTMFTIMPAGQIRDYKRKVAVLELIAKTFDIKIRLPKYDRDKPRFNLSKTLAELMASELVLVDLTHERPSCYYELGLAEALGRPLMIVARLRTPIHQTSLRSHVLFYRTIRDFEELITERIRRGH